MDVWRVKNCLVPAQQNRPSPLARSASYDAREFYGREFRSIGSLLCRWLDDARGLRFASVFGVYLACFAAGRFVGFE